MNEPDHFELHALQKARDDEYRSWATYDQVIADFGDVAPFLNIREPDARHIGALRALYSRYQLPWPKSPWTSKVDCYPNVKAAWVAAVVGEIANGEMYTRLLAGIQTSDFRIVMHRSQEASERRHLAAFQVCARGDSGTCAGGGRERRHRGKDQWPGTG